MVNYPLTGGLDLTTPKPESKPGRLVECLNFEVSTLNGYTRISGLARFDGSEDVGGFKVWRLKYNGAGTFTAGTQAWFDVALKGWVLSTAVQDGIKVVYLMMPGAAPAPGLPSTLTDGTTSVSILSRDVLFEGEGTQTNFNDGYASIEAAQRTRIGQVPGRPGSDIIGGFWFKDRMYVIRDLPRIAFEGGYYTDADEGKYLTIDGQEYKILDVTITGDGVGVLTYDTTPGSGTDAAPIGAATLVDLPVTGDYGPAYTGLPYNDDLDVSGGILPYTWSLFGDEGTSINPIESPDANDINFIPQTTNAALYRSSPDGWVRCALGREMQFDNGTTGINNFLRSAVLSAGVVKNSGAVYPGTGTINGAATSNMGANDGTDAALGAGTSNVFVATNFNFASIPANATITGIEVVVERHSNTGNEAVDNVVTLTGLSTGNANKARGVVWPNAPTTITYGGPTDLWDTQALSAAVVKDADFGVRILAKRSNPANAMVGGIDFVTIKVYYIERDSNVYVWNGTTDVPIVLHHTQILGGDPTLGTATGYLNISADDNATKPRLITVGDEVRTATGGGGTLLCKVAARDRPIWLPGQAELDANRARYQFEKANFYGQDEFEAVYGACGSSPAFSYDGSRCIRIRTELPAEKDLPRHITKHGDMLVLGFFPGAILFSNVGDPYETRGEYGASVVEVGDRLTGLCPLAGDALGIVCQSMTQVIRGLTPESMVKSPISAKRGGIEYTAVDMGRIVLCDGLGIFLADTPEMFGAAARSYISQMVHPWLAPRLQAQANTEAAYLRPVCALNVRNKNQMRLYFWDGWCLTMTMNEPPEFTTQRYFTPAADAHSEPTPWVPRMIASGIDSSGRERLFCSFYGGVKEGLVFEMDAGRSFDGDPIPAHVVLSPLTIAQPTREKRHDRFHLYGRGLSWASLTASRLVNDGDSFTGQQSFNMGRGDALARLKMAPMRGVVDAPVEAFDVSLRFESNSADEGNFVLQYIAVMADDRGQTRGRQGS